MEADAEEYLLRAREAIETARSMPMSASVLVSREELTALIDDALTTLPEELKRARWILREKEDILNEARREADAIIEAAKVEAARRVERTELVRESQKEAERVRSEADAQARQMRHEAEDYVDQKLATFEVVLDRTMQAVQKGRERLNLVPTEEEVDLSEEESAFFDQENAQQ